MAKTNDEILDDWHNAKAAFDIAAPSQKTAAFRARHIARHAAIERFGMGKHLEVYNVRFPAASASLPAWHGSDAVSGGKLIGTTDTDHFYFFCPKCADRHVMRVLDHRYHQDPGSVAAYPAESPEQVTDFTLAFKLYCPECRLTDYVKLGNIGTGRAVARRMTSTAVCTSAA